MAAQPWEEESAEIMNSAWKGRIGIAEVRKDRYSCVNQFVRPKEWKCLVMASGVEDPVGWDLKPN